MTKTATKLEALPSMFENFQAFMTGTLSQEDAAALRNKHPEKFKYAYGVAKRDEGGVLHTRYLLREHNDATGKGTTTPDGSKPAKVKFVGEVRNGVKHPSPTSVAVKVWTMFDELYAIRKEPFTKMTMEMAAITRGFNIGNVKTELSLWRKFHGFEWKVQ